MTAEFPAVRFTEGAGEAPAEALRAEAWEAPGFDFWAFDRDLDALVEEGRPLLLAAAVPERLPRFASEVLTRAQRLLDRRNAASRSRLFGSLPLAGAISTPFSAIFILLAGI